VCVSVASPGHTAGATVTGTIGAYVGSMLMLLTISCLVTDPAAPISAPPAPSSDAVVEVAMAGATPTDPAEARTWIAAELALHAVPEVVVTSPAGRAPSVRGTPAAPWRLELWEEGGRAAASLCPPAGNCELARFDGSPEARGVAVAGWVARQLGQFIEPDAVACIDAPADDYAALWLGRAALDHYAGVGDHRDVRRDALRRAVFLDARVATAQWMLARRLDAHGDPEAPRHGQVAAQRCPAHAGLSADLATWSSSGVPQELRFVVGALERSLDSGSPDEELARTAALAWPLDAHVADLAARATQGTVRQEHLRRWSGLDPRASEPELALARMALDEGRWHDVVTHGRAAEARGAEEAREILVPALLALGQLELAADLAPANLAARIAARGGDDTDTGSGALGPEGLLLAASRVLRVDPTQALSLAEEALRLRPDWPEALGLASRAADAAGVDGALYRDRLALVEPT